MTGSNRDRKIKVLVVDDSVLIGIQITKILSSDTRLQVVGRAKDGVEALELVEKLKPDVVTLDVEMPRMDGLTALKHIMVRFPVPTIMLSALTLEGARATFDALRFGALDVIAKPSRRETESLEEQAHDIITRVKRAATIGVGKARYRKRPAANPLMLRRVHGSPDASTRFIGVGAGTGSYHCLLQLVPNLRADFNDVLIAVLDVAPRYVEPFVSYLRGHSSVPVKSVRDVGFLETGTCYISSCGDCVALVRDSSGRFRFGTPSTYSNWSAGSAIDILLKSLAAAAGPRSVGVIMSGAGSDGAEGYAMIRAAGGTGVVQALTSCMNPSMPKAALLKSPADKILPDYLIAEFLMMTRSANLKRDSAPQIKAANATSR